MGTKKFTMVITEDDIVETRLYTDPTGQPTAYVGYRARIDGEWREIISYDNCHGKGNHGDRYHADGSKSPINRRTIPQHLDRGGFSHWARGTLSDIWYQERQRYEEELRELTRAQAQRRQGGGWVDVRSGL